MEKQETYYRIKMHYRVLNGKILSRRIEREVATAIDVLCGARFEESYLKLLSKKREEL